MTTIKKYDYIIVGQGVAGTCLAFQLIKQGKKVLVIDEHNPNSSSNVATGIINPITGRKMVKSWMVEELLPFAKSFYNEMEEELGIECYFSKPIYKIFNTVQEQNEYLLKSDEAEYEEYLSPIIYPDWVGVKTPFGVGTSKQTAWVDLALLIQSFRDYLKENNCLLDEKVDYNELTISNEGLTYKTIAANKIVFCEGFKGRYNPFFNHLPFSFAKGETLTIKCNDLNYLDGILNKGGQIIPINDNLFSVGSTFKWDDIEETTTEQGLAELKKKFEKTCSLPYEIVEHKVGIRPTVKDRRPFLGASPKSDNVYVFNGMGTKGISLSPYFANHLIWHMEKGEPLLKEVDIKRFD
ncbi:MAG: FAD-binding oxidoreductase [Chitinophagales bacterium]